MTSGALLSLRSAPQPFNLQSNILTDHITGLNTDQVQKYQAAATAAGAQSSAFTDAIKELRDRAKEAAKGNVEISAAFQALG